MLRRNDVDVGAVSSAVRYLWNLESPMAIDVLREAYDRSLLRDDPRLWLWLCQALASCGDGRGLGDAYTVLVSLERPAEPPAEEKLRRKWDRARADQRDQAQAVFGGASKELLAEFLVRKTVAGLPEERRVVLRLLWKLPDIPQPLAAIIPRWAHDADPQVAELASRLLDRALTSRIDRSAGRLKYGWHGPFKK